MPVRVFVLACVYMHSQERARERLVSLHPPLSPSLSPPLAFFRSFHRVFVYLCGAQAHTNVHTHTYTPRCHLRVGLMYLQSPGVQGSGFRLTRRRAAIMRIRRGVFARGAYARGATNESTKQSSSSLHKGTRNPHAHEHAQIHIQGRMRGAKAQVGKRATLGLCAAVESSIAPAAGKVKKAGRGVLQV